LRSFATDHLRERVVANSLEVKCPSLGTERSASGILPIDRYTTIVEGEQKWQ